MTNADLHHRRLDAPASFEPDPDGLEMLREVLSSSTTDPAAARSAAIALGIAGDPDDFDTLAATLDDRELRKGTLEPMPLIVAALGPRVLPRIVEVLEHTEQAGDVGSIAYFTVVASLGTLGRAHPETLDAIAGRVAARFDAWRPVADGPSSPTIVVEAWLHAAMALRHPGIDRAVIACFDRQEASGIDRSRERTAFENRTITPLSPETVREELRRMLNEVE